MIPIKLYRGDKKGNVTLPEQYGTAGLLTKLINNGDPAYITKEGIEEASRVHIAPTKAETILSSRSHFLSFTSCRDRALYYAADKEPDNLIPGEGDKQRYLFSLDISACVATVRRGVFSLVYDCSLNICALCIREKQKHQLLLIDVVTLLSEHASYAKSKDALEKARRDSEWLVLPIDYIPRLHGFLARIVPSSIWDAENYFLI